MPLAGERFELESVGELTLEGKPLPVPAWRLVGRAEEVAAPGVLDGDSTGVGGLAAVVGEPGVGTSRLGQEVRASAEAR